MTDMTRLDRAIDDAVEDAVYHLGHDRVQVGARVWQRMLADPAFNHVHSNTIAERVAAALIDAEV